MIRTWPAATLSLSPISRHADTCHWPVRRSIVSEFHPFAGRPRRQAMHVEETADQKALRAEFRAYLAGVVTPSVRAATLHVEGGEVYCDVIRRMGRDGWLTPGWPVE